MRIEEDAADAVNDFQEKLIEAEQSLAAEHRQQALDALEGYMQGAPLDPRRTERTRARYDQALARANIPTKMSARCVKSLCRVSAKVETLKQSAAIERVEGPEGIVRIIDFSKSDSDTDIAGQVDVYLASPDVLDELLDGNSDGVFAPGRVESLDSELQGTFHDNVPQPHGGAGFDAGLR